jgi:ethanolamine utilization protein EutA (predicted chaperonin)
MLQQPTGSGNRETGRLGAFAGPPCGRYRDRTSVAEAKVSRRCGRYRAMVTSVSGHVDDISSSELEFFGIKLKVKNPKLASLLNSDVNEDVTVIGRRTVDLIARADEDELLAVDRFNCEPADVD